VTDSLGAKVEVAYAPMSDRSVYTPDAGCTYPRHCPQRGRWLVSEVRRSTGVARQPMTTERHSYARAAVDLAGRDWLGFSGHTVTNVERGSETVYQFDNLTRVGNMYPFAGLVQSEETTFPPSDDKLHWIKKTSTYTNLATSSDRVLVRPEQACEFRYEVDQPRPRQPIPYVSVCTTYSGYDAYGFAKDANRTGGIETRTSETLYEHRDVLTPRILGIVTQVRESSTANGRTETRTTRIEPDDHGLPKKETIEPDQPANEAPLTLVTEYLRNDVGQPTEMTVTGDSAAPPPEGGPWTPTPQTRKTLFFYDAHGYPLRTINSLGHEEHFVHDAGQGVLAGHLNANGVFTRHRFDGFGRNVASHSPVEGNAFTSYEFDSQSPLITKTTRSGQDATVLAGAKVHHDMLGRPVFQQTLAPKSRAQNIWTRYHVLGPVYAISAPQFSEDESQANYGSRHYDRLDRLILKTDPDSVASAKIDRFQNITTVTNARGKKQVVWREDLGLVTRSQSQDENGNLKAQVVFTYGPFGLVETVSKEINGVRVDTTMSYDRLGRRTSIHDPDRGLTRYSYNAFGEMVHERDPTGAIAQRRYDLLGRPLTVTNSDGTTEFVYDVAPGGLVALAWAKSPDQVETSRSYDSLGRLTNETVTIPALTEPGKPGSLEVERWYDAAGRLGGIRYPRATTDKRFEIVNRYSSSAGGILWSVKDGAGKTLWQAEDFNALGDVIQEVYGNKLRVRREIDPLTTLLRRIQSGFVGDAFYDETGADPVPGFPDGATLIQDLFYCYDYARNVTERRDHGRAIGSVGPDISVYETYGYDDLNRLSAWSVTAGGSTTADTCPSVATGGSTTAYTYGFDDYGNLKGRTTPSGLNEWSFLYDDPSRPHAITSSTMAGVTKTFDYDGRGRRFRDGDRIISYRWFDLPERISRAGATLAEFEYDAFQARVRKKSQGIETVTLGDLYERKAPSSSLATADHVYRVPGPGRVVAEVEWDAAGAPRDERYLQVDRLNSIELITGVKPDSGNLPGGRQRFEPYGNAVDPSNPTNGAAQTVVAGTRRGFTGHEHDAELGLVNMQGRIYDPSSATFLSPHPIVSHPGMAHTFHPYSYVINNPANLVDPTGFQAAGVDASEVDAVGEVQDSGICAELKGGIQLQVGPNYIASLRSSDENGTAPDTVLVKEHFGATRVWEGKCEAGGKSKAGGVSSLTSDQPDMEAVFANLAVTTLVEPVLWLLSLTGPDAPKFDLNKVRPFPYTEEQRRLGEGMELGMGALLTLANPMAEPSKLGTTVRRLGFLGSRGVVAKSGRGFMNSALKIIKQNPHHPLRFLVDPDTGKWIARSHLSQEPAVQAGHLVSRHSGAAQRFALEDAFFNQVSNWKGETQGAIFTKSAVDIQGVAVELRTAQMWKRLGLLE
jgi:RHS repeat-associated protein